MRCATWAAVSSESQAGDDKVSIPDQQAMTRRKAEEIGATVVAELVVPGISRELLDFPTACRTIPAYQELKDLIDNRKIDLLIFLNRGRLGRTMSLVEGLALYCLWGNVALYDLSSPPSSLIAQQQLHSSGDQLTGVIQSWRYQNEMSELRKRHERGMIGRIKNGEFPTVPPFGYRRVYNQQGNYQTVIEDAQAEAIREVYRLFLAGYGKPSIALRMKAKGYLSPAGVWSETTVATLLDGVKTYSGNVEVNRIAPSGRPYTIAPGKHPPIICQEVAQQIVTERSERVKARRSVNTPYLYSRLVWCGKCNKRMVVGINRIRFMTRQGEQHRTYTTVKCHHCNRTLAFAKLKEAFLLFFDTVVQGKLILAQPEGTDAQSISTQVEQLQVCLKELVRKDSRLQSAYVDGDIEQATYKAQVKRLREERERLSGELQTAEGLLLDTNDRQVRLGELHTLASVGLSVLESENVTEANAILRRYFKVTFEENKDILITVA